MSRLKQGLRVELDPTVEQRARLGQHAGLSRVAETSASTHRDAAIIERVIRGLQAIR